jgi:hypothetical protein
MKLRTFPLQDATSPEKVKDGQARFTNVMAAFRSFARAGSVVGIYPLFLTVFWLPIQNVFFAQGRRKRAQWLGCRFRRTLKAWR